MPLQDDGLPVFRQLLKGANLCDFPLFEPNTLFSDDGVFCNRNQIDLFNDDILRVSQGMQKEAKEQSDFSHLGKRLRLKQY